MGRGQELHGRTMKLYSPQLTIAQRLGLLFRLGVLQGASEE